MSRLYQQIIFDLFLIKENYWELTSLLNKYIWMQSGRVWFHANRISFPALSKCAKRLTKFTATVSKTKKREKLTKTPPPMNPPMYFTCGVMCPSLTYSMLQSGKKSRTLQRMDRSTSGYRVKAMHREHLPVHILAHWKADNCCENSCLQKFTFRLLKRSNPNLTKNEKCWQSCVSVVSDRGRRCNY